MPAPGVTVAYRDFPVPSSLPTDSGVGFMAVLAEKGPIVAPTLIRSLDEYGTTSANSASTKFGTRTGFTVGYDAVDEFFRFGGERLYVTRVLGASPVTAFFMLQDSVPANTLKVEASSPGTWGNSLNVQVLAGDQAGE